MLDWLIAFEEDPARHVVLDWDWFICSEYQNKLDLQQDYGWLAVMAKKDRNEVAWVGLRVDSDGHAVLPEALAAVVADLEDRKMAAAVLEARKFGHACRLVNACDTDWLDCGSALAAAGVEVEHILEDWLRAKHLVKHA